ncbi:L-serine ammonia-lyase, iron-sulfur-dependent, subunit alpha, partial [Geobacillus stearothermophilus]|uniref:L-serine ammonia-lyase, iron-sulfur-dependent, subunit beta n=2 Tax=Geobacillus stearothermophilus TaxID=1422 RepID=UPI003D1DBC20
VGVVHANGGKAPMKYKSVFDIIGPVMVGPSSSHTAGAARIGLIARKLFGRQPEWACISFYGSFAETYRGHGTDVAIVAGLLGFDTFDERIPDALAIALKNMLGLVCDPVAGLVEVPCVKRNAMGAANAMIAADMALAGVKSRIPCDEVIEAMYRIGAAMPVALKETAQGGLAATPTGRAIAARIFGASAASK